MINRSDILTSFFNQYLDQGLYCWWSEEENKIIISDIDDGEIDSFDMENFENE